VNIKLPLTGRLLLFNVLVLFLPVATLLYLDTYESQLLTLQERAMVQQGRILSAALQDHPLEEAASIIANLEQRLEARIRVVDKEGVLVADSAREAQNIEETAGTDKSLSLNENPLEGDALRYAEESASDPSIRERIGDSFLYRVYRQLYKTYKYFFQPPGAEMSSGKYYSGKDILLGEEIQAALEGRYGAVTRVSTGTQRSVNLYSALPVFSKGEVSGAILISQSTYKILEDLYKLRLDIIRIFSLSLLISIILSLLLSLQITRPIVRLSRRAGEVLDSSGQFTGHFPVFKRRDELGDLSRSLQTLSRRLEQKILFIDSMTADMVHELKNPLSSLASSMDIMEEDCHPHLFKSMKAQVHRMDGLLNRLRELTSIEQRMEKEETAPLNLREYIPLFISLHLPWAKEGLLWSFMDEEDFILEVRGDRLTQVLLNLLENARSFSPPGEPVRLELYPKERTILVIDKGPGVPEGNRDKLFHRFFSDRKERDNHSGLGLAIVQAIMKGYGGSVEYQDTPDGGSTFILRFPSCHFPGSRLR